MLVVWCCFFFFKQKTAYEMRISDWSSDVCSSDLGGTAGPARGRGQPARPGSRPGRVQRGDQLLRRAWPLPSTRLGDHRDRADPDPVAAGTQIGSASFRERVGPDV